MRWMNRFIQYTSLSFALPVFHGQWCHEEAEIKVRLLVTLMMWIHSKRALKRRVLMHIPVFCTSYSTYKPPMRQREFSSSFRLLSADGICLAFRNLSLAELHYSQPAEVSCTCNLCSSARCFFLQDSLVCRTIYISLEKYTGQNVILIKITDSYH
jgi:hypothetical protein